MKNERDPWVRVKDESELRAGMAVQLRPCSHCGRRELFLLAKCHGMTISVDPAGKNGPTGIGFATLGRCATSPSADVEAETLSPATAIREGRLYRLADDQLADDAEPATVVRGRETERAR